MNSDEEEVEQDPGSSKNKKSNKQIKFKIESTDTYKKIRGSDVLDLIELVEPREELWRITSADYKDCAKVNTAWTEVEQQCNFLYRNRGYAAKRVWFTLVADYKKEVLRMKHQSSGSSPYTPSFDFYIEMTFLEENAKCKLPKRINVEQSDSTIREDPQNDNNHTPKESSSSRERQTPKRKRIQAEEDNDDGMSKLLKMCIGELQKCNEPGPTTPKTSPHSDIIEKVTSTLNSLQPIDQLKLKIQISNICDSSKGSVLGVPSDFLVNDNYYS